MDHAIGIVFALVGLVFACVGLYFLGSAIVGIIRSIISRSWIPTEGKILSSEVKVEIEASTSPTGASYDSRIEYEYEVNGRRFTGNNLNFSRFKTNTPAQAAQAVRHYPPGAAVTVYHDIWHPERSVLEPGKIGVHISGLILGGAVALFGTFFGLGGWFGFDTLLGGAGERLGIDEGFIWQYFPPFVILLGIGIIVAGVMAGNRSRKARRWPTVEGKVVASGVVRERSSSSSSTTTQTTGSYVYKAEVAYEYEVNGERYVSNRIQLLDIASSNQNRAATIQDGYPEGKSVRVYYDPKHPDKAVLEPGGGGGSGLLIVVGSGFVIIASILMSIHSFVSR